MNQVQANGLMVTIASLVSSLDRPQVILGQNVLLLDAGGLVELTVSKPSPVEPTASMLLVI